MKRLLRMLLNVAAAVSLLLAVAVVVLWVRDYNDRFIVRHVAWSGADGRGVTRIHGIMSSHGGIAAVRHVKQDSERPDPEGGPPEGWSTNRTVGEPEYPLANPRRTWGRAVDVKGASWYVRTWRGFEIVSYTIPVGPAGRGAVMNEVRIAMPCWAWLALFAILPMLRAVAIARRLP